MPSPDQPGSPDFTGLHTIVTGGGGALGSAVVDRLLAAGATVAIPCLSDRELARIRERVQAHGLTGLTATGPMDLSDEPTVEAFYREHAKGPSGRPLWASIHIAGGFGMGPLTGTSLADYRAQMDMNATTCFLCCREAVRAMQATTGTETSGPSPDASPGGRIVNVTAKPALFCELGSGMVPYTASKAAVAAITQSLACELKAQRIWVNAVAPSIMDTPANREAMPGAEHHAWPKLDEVAETIVFLASPANRATRGAIVPVYGES